MFFSALCTIDNAVQCERACGGIIIARTADETGGFTAPAQTRSKRYKMEQEKQRIIQEFVPGKQVTLAHVIANPDSSLYKKLGVIGDYTGALGIMTITPSEGAIIGADVAMKAANVEVVFVDRFNGSLIINGTVADVEAAVKDVLNVLENTLHFAPTVITKS